MKKFLEWFGLKEKIDKGSVGPSLYKDGDVWWCALGENIGIEINGKGQNFLRPILIYRKLSKDGFLGVPLSTKIKKGSWYVDIVFHEQTHSANLSQIRVLSSYRLYKKMCELDDGDYKKVKDGFLRLYS